jgi:hypothetical protein
MKFLTLALLFLQLLTFSSQASTQDLREIDWLELMPPEDLAALEAMGEIDHSGFVINEALSSSKTVPTMDGAVGKIPGYVVPLSFDDRGRITEMFLVPYFGACIHMPPPPPNQIIHIRPGKPLAAGELWDAYWAIGTLRITPTENETAQAAYSMDLERLELYDE